MTHHNNITIYKPVEHTYTNKYTLKTVTINSHPYFSVKDLGRLMGYKNIRATMSNHDSRNKIIIPIQVGNKHYWSMYINLSSLFRLVNNTIHEAEGVKQWLFNKVIPSLMK